MHFPWNLHCSRTLSSLSCFPKRLHHPGGSEARLLTALALCPGQRRAGWSQGHPSSHQPAKGITFPFLWTRTQIPSNHVIPSRIKIKGRTFLGGAATLCSVGRFSWLTHLPGVLIGWRVRARMLIISKNDWLNPNYRIASKSSLVRLLI